MATDATAAMAGSAVQPLAALSVEANGQSAASVSSDGSHGSGPARPHSRGQRLSVDANLTSEVRHFKEGLGRLRRSLTESEGVPAARKSSHERLAEVLRILRSMFDNYPSLKCPELVHSVEVLMQLVQTIKVDSAYEDVDWPEIVQAVDTLALTFSSRMSEYVAGELTGVVAGAAGAVSPAAEPPLHLHLKDSAFAPDSNSRQHSSPVGRKSGEATTAHLNALSWEEVERIMMRHPKGVDRALCYAKEWDKYTKYVSDFVKKRASLELEWARQLSVLAVHTRPFLQAESHMPYQSLYCTALDQDQEMCTKTLATCSVLQGSRFTEPLAAKRLEQAKQRKQLKERWRSELKMLQKSVGTLKKVRAAYMESKKEHCRYQEAVRIAQQGAEIGATGENKVEKRKKLEEEAAQKCKEQEEIYKRSVVEANVRHRQVLDTKVEVLRQVRELIRDSDQTIKKVTVAYFQLQHELTLPVPVQFQTLCERSRLYEPGAAFSEFVRTLLQDLPPAAADASPTREPFVFEPFNEELMMAAGHSSSSSSSNHPRRSSQEDDGGTYRHRPDRNFEMWSSAVDDGSDSDSGGSGDSAKSRDTSPSASPVVRSRPLPAGAPGFSFSEQGEDVWDGGAGAAGGAGGAGAGSAAGASASAAEDSASGQAQQAKLSKAAMTHRFRKIKTPRTCNECDSIIMYFQGIDCPECGICVHKKCLSDVSLQCGFKRLGRKVATFKVDLGQHLLEAGAQVPPLVCKCADEIDQRGLQVKGIYRMSGVKHKVEKLCQDFERGPELVLLSDVHPNVITNVLKLYLRQLPEPLITFDLYSDFIRFGRAYPLKATEPPAQPNPEQEEVMLQQLGALCKRLPKHHLRTLGFLMHHLQRVSRESETNNMPAFNLAIVFGPTLMRPRGDDSASLSSIVDNDHQTRIVLLLIEHATEIFGPADSVLPLDYAKYTNPVFLPSSSKFEKRHKASKRNNATTERSASVAAPMMGAFGVGETGELYGPHSERRSFDAGHEEFQGLPTQPQQHGGQMGEWESNEDYGSDEEEEDDDAEAIPSCWLPDESGKTKKSPLLAQPKIIKVSLGKFTGVEGVTPEKLSTQDSLESTQRLAKQPSADVYQASTAARKSVPQEGKSESHHPLQLQQQQQQASDGNLSTAAAASTSRLSESLFAKMGKAAKKGSLDQTDDYLAATASAKTDGAAAKVSPLPPTAKDDAKPVLRSSTSPGSGRSSLVIGIGQQSPTQQPDSAVGNSNTASSSMQHEHRVRIQVQQQQQNPASRHAPVTKQSSVKDES